MPETTPARHFTITIPGRFPGLNDMIAQAKRGYRALQPYAVDKADYTEQVFWAARICKIPQHLSRVSVNITWIEPDRRRDPDNLTAGVKYIMDGLVMAQIIRDDSQKYVAGISHQWQVDPNNPRIVVEISEI